MKNIRVFLCGDVMIGRGIDQILPHPSQPQLYESYVKDARDYVVLAEALNGKIPYPVSMDYIWGDALAIWQSLDPDVKIINLETAITTSDSYMPDKGINYRMHPLNVDTLNAAGINICTLANNHILDWDYQGLTDTLSTLEKADIKFAGAGQTLDHALKPAIYDCTNNKRILIFAAGSASSGVSPLWRATHNIPGVYYLPGFNEEVLLSITENIEQHRQPGDLIIFSIHWGSNWGYEIPASFRAFAHGLIDIAKVDVVFGHSSHHPRSIEIYHNKPILYGCGDFINDYEGISGFEEFRSDLTLMYFLDFDTSSLSFNKLTIVPLQIKNFSLHRTTPVDRQWLLQLLNTISINMQFVAHDQGFIFDTAV